MPVQSFNTTRCRTTARTNDGRDGTTFDHGLLCSRITAHRERPWASPYKFADPPKKLHQSAAARATREPNAQREPNHGRASAWQQIWPLRELPPVLGEPRPATYAMAARAEAAPNKGAPAARSRTRARSSPRPRRSWPRRGRGLGANASNFWLGPLLKSAQDRLDALRARGAGRARSAPRGAGQGGRRTGATPLAWRKALSMGTALRLSTRSSAWLAKVQPAWAACCSVHLDNGGAGGGSGGGAQGALATSCRGR